VDALQNELGAIRRREFGQKRGTVAASLVDIHDLVEGALGFLEILLALVVGFIDFLPWRGEKNQRSISILHAGGVDRLQEAFVGQPDEPGVAEGIGQSSIGEHWFPGRSVLKIGIDGALQHEARIGLPIGPGESQTPGLHLFLNDLTGYFRGVGKPEFGEFGQERGLARAGTSRNYVEIRVCDFHFELISISTNSPLLDVSWAQMECRAQRMGEGEPL